MKIISCSLSRSRRADKKWTAVIVWKKTADDKEHLATVNFGASGYQDYTQHRDAERWKRYIARHRLHEDWSASGVLTAGWWSRWLLWNRPSFNESLRLVEEKLGIRVVLK